MNIYVVNKSTVVSDQEVQSWIPAFNQYAKIVRRWWPRQAGSVLWVSKDHEPSEAWKVIIADSSDQAGALGYHDFTPGGRPISYVFAADDKKYGYSVPVTATHEIAEMIADPWISELFQVSDRYCYAKEICDAVEADELCGTITISGFPPVQCSDFVLPHWFIPGSTDLFDWRNHIKKPLQLLPGGYMSVLDLDNGQWNQINADMVNGGVSPANKDKAGFGRLERYGRTRGNPVELDYLPGQGE